MTVGFGLSIGTVNSVWAAAGDRDRPTVRVRRTAVTFDRAGGPKMGGLPRFAPVVTDFADLTREMEPVVLGGRVWTSADLVAAVATGLIAADEPEAEPVITYPACYSERRITALRHALDWAGTTEVLLMPEPVAAVEWLDAQYGVSGNGLTLVYDLGGSSLDVAVVRTEADRDDRGVLGKAVRSHEYGGRPLGAILARYARALSPGAPSPVSKVVPAVDTTRLRTWNVRNSLRLVRRCVHAAGLTMSDIDRVLLVGGASRPVEVAQVLAELDRPVVISPDPAHTVAVGAALASARLADTGVNLGRYARGAAVLSSAAVASALAMSAATMLGGGPIGSDGPTLEFAPALAGPAENPAPDIQVFDGEDSGPADMPADAAPFPAYAGTPRHSSSARSDSTVAQPVSAATVAVVHSMSAHGPGTHCSPVGRLIPPTYADPAQFSNPLPFVAEPLTLSTPGSAIPEISLPPAQRSAGPATAHQVSLPGAVPAMPNWLGPPVDSAPSPMVTNTPPVNPTAGTPVADTGTPPPADIGPGSSDITGAAQNSATGYAPGASPGVTAPGGVADTTYSGGATSPGASSSGAAAAAGVAAGGASAGGAASAGAHAGGTTSAGASTGGNTSSSAGGGTSRGTSSSAGGASHVGGSHAGSSSGGSHGGGHH